MINYPELTAVPEWTSGANTENTLYEATMSDFTEKFHAITVAFNPNAAQSTGTYVNITGHEFWEQLKILRIGDKNGTHFLRTGLKHDAHGKCLSRGDNHCEEEAWLIIIDVDDSTAPPHDVHEALKQAYLAHIIIGTHSYYADNQNRFRILILCENAYSKDQLKPTSEAIVETINCFLTDGYIEYAKENKAYSQSWFMPSKPLGCDKPMLYLEYTEGQSFPVKNKQVPPDISQAVASTVALAEGQLSPITEWNRQFPVGTVLEEHGYKLVFRNKETCRWLSPNSTTGQGGVTEDQNTGKIYSHHNDCLNDNYRHDSFDAMRLLKDFSFEEAVKFASQQTKSPDGRTVDAYNKGMLGLSPFYKLDPPLSLPDPRPEVMKLHPDMLPLALRGFILDVAERQQCQPDFIAVAAIVGLSGLLGRKILICPKQHDDWQVTPNQWGAIIGRPSAMKSPSMKAALKPLQQLEAKAAKQYAEENKHYDEECELIKLEKEAAKGKAKTALKNNNREEARDILRMIDIDLPIRARLIVNDSTIEKLGELLNENPNGLILVRDELAGWLSKLAKEEHQGDRAFYLECFDGNSQFTYDRIGRGTIEIKYCTLAVIGGIQPTKIARLVREAMTGIADDGLIQRLQLAVWPDDKGCWEWLDRAPDKAAMDAYHGVFEYVSNLQFDTPDDEPPALRFTLDAQSLFIKWMEEIQAKAREQEVHPAIESHMLKMPQTIAGLALLFEIIDGGLTAVGVEATARALDWADYLLSHAKRLYSIATNQSIHNARLILERKNKLSSPFTAREIHRKQWAGLDNICAVNEALECLIDYRQLVPKEHSSTTNGGRPTISYQWNTLVERGH